MEISEFYTTVEALHGEARRRKLYFQASEDSALSGRSLRLNGRDLVSFGSCSYLGLEFHPALKQGVIDAVERYGTQFSYSRAYIASPAYREAEELLSEIFGGHVMIASTTSLGHQNVLPGLAMERDAIVLDNQAHHSIQKAATLAQAGGARVEIVRHFELDDKALDTVERLARKHRHVYFAIDGVYSMYGDCAPVGLIQQILDVARNVRIYVDDAHGMSWAGKHGRGWFLDQMELNDRVIFGTSLNKAYSAAGGVFVFSDRNECEKVRMQGGPYAFSGPPQPPMLGAIVASAKVHLSDEIAQLQADYRQRVELMNSLMAEYDLPLLSRNEGPIFFLRMGKAQAAYSLAERMYDEGFYVNTSTYPMVPMKRAGMRITTTALHTEEQIRGLCAALAHHLPLALEENRVDPAELDLLFERALPSESWGGIDLKSRVATAAARVEPRVKDSSLRIERYGSVHDIDAESWDRWMEGRGASSWSALSMAERVFRDQPLREYNWDWRYLVAFDQDGEVAGATYCTRALTKDDMWMRPEVSAIAEDRRKVDPYFLSSDTLLLGSSLSEGNHLYIRAGADAAAVREALIAELEVIAEEWGVQKVALRDFAAEDQELESWMHDRDWVKVPILDSYRVADVGASEEEMIAARVNNSNRAKRARRYFKGLAEHAPNYRRVIYGLNGEQLPQEGVPHLYRLYRNVSDKALRIKDFGFPEDLIGAMLQCPSWEVVGLHLHGQDGPPVAWYAAHRGGSHYSPFLCGVDYDFVTGEYGAYRQVLLQITRRAREVGATTVHLGYDAETEKRRIGAEPHAMCVYARSQDHDSGERMQELVTALGLANSDVELVS